MFKARKLSFCKINGIDISNAEIETEGKTETVRIAKSDVIDTVLIGVRTLEILGPFFGSSYRPTQGINVLTLLILNMWSEAACLIESVFVKFRSSIRRLYTLKWVDLGPRLISNCIVVNAEPKILMKLFSAKIAARTFVR
jgi:hypothetical protein